MIEQLYAAVADRLLEKVPELNWIDWDWGQLEVQDNDQDWPVQFDCALIDIVDVTWTSVTKGIQKGVATVQIRIGIDLYSDLHIADGITAPDRSLAIQKMSLGSKVHLALHKHFGTFFNHLNRVRTTTEKRADGIKVITVIYQCGLVDNTAAEEYATATPTLTLTKQVQ